MKQVKLLSLRLENFKGIKNFKLDANASNVRVFGDNAVGKTTIFDAFVWLLFDKDSQNRKDFSIKTLDKTGKALHNLEHTVEADFLIDNTVIKLKKVYKEKWTKKRGNAVAEFTGHTTDYEVDGVPVNKKEYTAKVAEIVDEEVFKLLTSPTYFNEHLDWKKRREILLQVAGNVTDQEVINSKAELAKLNDFLSGKSIEDMKKIIASRKKNINEELDKIPVRIDEIVKMTPETNIDVEALRSKVTQIESEIDSLREQKLNVQNGAAVVEKKKELQEIEMQLTDLKRDFEADSLQEVYKLQAKVQECSGNLQIVESKFHNIQFEIKDAQNRKEVYERRKQLQLDEISDLRTKWTEVNAQQFQFEDKCECPTATTRASRSC